MVKPKGPEVETISTNRKALMRYHILDTFEAGVELKGPEVKSLRNKQANIEAAYARLDNEEVMIYNLHIAPYIFNTAEPLDPVRTRRLLLHKAEIKRIGNRMTGKRLTLVPLEIYFKHGWAKVRLGIAESKAAPDRREEIKKRESDREVSRALRHRNR
jgi:SsrA-binding protein